MVRQHIEITGTVQGVGFRPWIYQLAQTCALAGLVFNSNAGVTIEVEGPDAALAEFTRRLHAEPPPLARIESITTTSIAPCRDVVFRIVTSRATLDAPATAHAQISPDTAPCRVCRTDYLDPTNRRYGYAFTNCTHCGPRYTITCAVPYDRPQTTMAAFFMCPACQQEYDRPASRRFHAQPNACPVCGPQLSAPLARAAAHLRAGNILALKNLGGYQLACDPANLSAVTRLRVAKHRPRKPFALLATSLAAVEQLCNLNATERELLQSPARPIVLLRRKHLTDPRVCPAVAPGQHTLGIMLPSSPLHELLLDAYGGELLLMTSGNPGSEPLAAEPDEAHASLAAVADAFLDHNRPIHARADDSVAFCSGTGVHIIRRARGYVPQPINFGSSRAPSILAAGAELKNTFCLTRGSQAFMSPHIGDMANIECFAFYEQTLKHYLKLFEIHPRILALDAHPGYLLNQWVEPFRRALSIEHVVRVQHHHAHIAACMAEHQLDGEVLGVAFDGTGYGVDGTIWGGEFLLASRAQFHRLAHLRPFPLPGGTAAIRQPWRIALALLHQALGPKALLIAQQLWPDLPAQRLHAVYSLLNHPSLSPTTSSAGRLFDAVASLLGLIPAPEDSSFEADPAMRLESAAAAEPPIPYAPFPMPDALDFSPTLAALATARLRGDPVGQLAARFHAIVAAAIVQTCRQHREAVAGSRVCLGGGVFQNQLLLAATQTQLLASGFRVYVPHLIPLNDGGLSLGQAAIAAAATPSEP